ncbi:ParB/RepB/Spo0J family partition protein [Azohydromonas australica]|uniref:ParB/RepB/Spo0J family partition protein n=1 Tax=Azohydromonas australica TaxID=364039 RepID=UPI0003FEDE69|nr:ParB/RepB/Spo0J family partition protein [Azohydromonas australica]
MRRTASLDLSFDLDAALEGPRVPDGKPLLLDPRTVRASRWVNRHETSFEDADFEELKTEIQGAGGNVQPIKVRPLKEPAGEARYEIVFGHRRHRACLELGVEVAAVVEEVGDQQLWAQMERENRARANLSAWEQGMMYVRALESGLFPSMLALARAIGRSQGDVSNAIAIARLPTEVVAAFGSPREIRFSDAKALKDAVAQAPEAVMEAAKELAGGDLMPASQVLKRLTDAALEGVRSSNPPAQAGAAGAAKPGKGQAQKSKSVASERRFKAGGCPVVIADDGHGAVVRFAPNALPRERWAELEKAVKKLLG